VTAFWDEITRLPPLPDEDMLRKMGDEVELQDRRRKARELVEAGQRVYTTYAAPISLALLVRGPLHFR
jgi:hypothetical protein